MFKNISNAQWTWFSTYCSAPAILDTELSELSELSEYNH
ncbi:hypothetical protein EDB32_12326 [Vibrio crassostreae]|nr:hypothetical protein EDB32_12326 [Vibrio crassostreae]